MIHIENVSYQYAESENGILKDFSLDIRDGECILLCGESGCGKTTVIRLINGLIPHFFKGTLNGTVHVEGYDVSSTPLEKISVKTGSVFQNPRSQFFCVDTTSEVAFGPENLGLPENEVRNRVDTAVKLLHTEALMDRNIFKLSGGEKQKIACTGVSAMGPQVIVLDEPTSNLDEDAIRMMAEVLKTWKEQGKTIIIAEHRLAWLRSVADRVISLEHGQIQMDLSGEQFFAKSDEELNALGLRSISPSASCMEQPTGFYRLLTDNNSVKPVGEKILLKNFSFSYSRKAQTLQLPEIEIPYHAIVAIIGRNGAGKSTFTKCLCGLQKNFKGSVIYENREYRKNRLNKLCFMVMQDVNHQLFTESVLEEVMLDVKEEGKELAEQILKRMDLESYHDRHPMSLSGGEKQRVAICSAYLSDRPIIIFDEPTSGLDYRRMESTANLIKELSREKTILIVTHDMELIQKCCTHVLHFENGRFE